MENWYILVKINVNFVTICIFFLWRKIYLVCGSLVGLNRFEDQNSLTQKCSPRVVGPFLDGEERESKPAAGSDATPSLTVRDRSGHI